MMKTTTAEKFEKYTGIAAQAGVKKSQFRNFLSHGYFANLKSFEFHAAARLADKDGGPTQIGCGGARGGSKSHTVFAQALLDDAQRCKGLKILYLRKAKKKAREQFDDLRQAVLSYTAHKYNRTEGAVYLPNGSKCLIGHFANERDVDDYLGLEYDLIVVEEHTALSLTKHRALRDSNRTSKNGWRPRIYSTTNPGNIGHGWYKKTFIEPHRSKDEQDTRFIPMTVDDNPHLDKDYKAKLEENTGWRLRAYRYGDWDIAAGQYFTTWRHDEHAREFEYLDPNWTYWLSIDYGFAHYTAVHLHVLTLDGVVLTVDEHGAQKWLPQRHAEAINNLIARHGLQWWMISDVVAGGDMWARDRDGKCPADDYERLLGVKLHRANMDRISGAQEILRRLGDIEAGLHPTWFIHPRCWRLVEAIPSMEHDPRRPEDVMKFDVDDEGDGGDDFYDSARYGLMNVWKPQAVWGKDEGLQDWRG